MSITASTRTVYFAPTKRRAYLTLKSAAHAEARAKIEAKYPTEKAEYDEVGRCTYDGYHWSEDEQLQRLYKRLSRMILSSFKRQSKKEQGNGN